MTTLYELKTRLKQFYAQYDIYIIPAAKFALALAVFFYISSTMGYNEKISSLPVTLVLSLLCCVLPQGATVLFAAAVTLLDLYSLSLEVCLVALILFLVVGLLYLRFSPKSAYMVVLTPVCFALHIPYIMPATAGLLYDPGSMASVLGGAFLYFFLHGITENASALSEISEEGSLTSGITSVVNQLTSNREMIVVLLVFALMMIVIYVLRKAAVAHAWSLAIGVGFMAEFVILFSAYLMMGMPSYLVALIIGNFVSVLIAVVIKFFFFHVDYKRTERVQFEDDDYYYYVKAVPKIKMPVRDKQVKKINTKHRK